MLNDSIPSFPNSICTAAGCLAAMRTCRHSQWLDLSKRGNEITLTQSDRAQTLLYSLPYFESQKPSLLVLIGNKSKSIALRDLISATGERRSIGKRGLGEIHLHADSHALFSDRPVLFADGDFQNQLKLKKVAPSENCHEVKSRILSIAAATLQTAADDLYFRFLSPFTDVFCFFAADLGGFVPIAQRIAAWLQASEPSSLPACTHSQIIIVTELPETETLEEFLCLLAGLTDRDPCTRFASIRVIHLLPDGEISSPARHRRLKEVLMDTSDQVRLFRKSSGTLFSAQHLAAFIFYSLDHFVTKAEEPFNFIRVSRLNNPPATDFTQRLTRFLAKIDTLPQLQKFAVPHIASTLLLDSYPPNMHRFLARDVFGELYRDGCYQACRDGVFVTKSSTQHLLPSGFVKLVVDCFADMFDKLCSRTTATAVDLHRQTLFSFTPEWLERRSNEDCLVCLYRTPQYRLPCGHCICENCVRVFGRQSSYDPWLFEVDSCFWCGQDTLGVVVKETPPTAGVRVLTFDGGGVRGLATLRCLQLLQDLVDLPFPIQENFDVVFGTSSGGINAAALCVNGWTVDQCIEQFENLAVLAFQPRPSPRIPILSWIVDLLVSRPRSFPRIPIISRIVEFFVSLFADGRYPSANLEAALQEAFGKYRSILDCSKATATGTKVGLPVTTIRDTSTCVFTNYNGVGMRPQGCGYHVLQSKGGSPPALLWEVTRCGSAAPSYFKPKHIQGVGTFQDGGLTQNDPGNLALQEVAAIYPFIDEPSLVVSLGTGSQRIKEKPRMSPTRGLFYDGFIPRLFRAFKLSMSSTDGHRFRSRQRQGRKEQYFRFDMEFEGPEPALDDTTRMQELKAAARSALEGSKELDRLAKCIVAGLFIFELECKPVKEHGRWLCTGRILCRLRANHPALPVLIEHLTKSSSKFLVQNRLEDPINSISSLDQDGNFCKRVEVELVDRNSPISIELQESNAQAFSISGSPFTIGTLIASQQLDACFGTSSHKKRRIIDSNSVVSRKRARY